MLQKRFVASTTDVQMFQWMRESQQHTYLSKQILSRALQLKRGLDKDALEYGAKFYFLNGTLPACFSLQCLSFYSWG